MNQPKNTAENSIPERMRAMRIHRIATVSPGGQPLEADRVRTPSPGAGEVLVRVHACGVCHTYLDEIEGRTEPPRP